MNWLAILTALIPLLQALLALLAKAKVVPGRADKQLAHAAALCSQINYHAARLGVGTSPVEEDEPPSAAH